MIRKRYGLKNSSGWSIILLVVSIQISSYTNNVNFLRDLSPVIIPEVIFHNIKRIFVVVGNESVQLIILMKVHSS